MLAVYAALAQGADCAADLADAFGRADVAYAAMDEAGFRTAHDDARTALGCLDETISVADAAAYHRLQALAAFLDHHDGEAVAAFRSSVELQPAFELPASLAPPGNPLRGHYQLARTLPPSATRPFDPPDGVQLYVDGRRSSAWPSERPWVLQSLDQAGAVSHTTWLPVGEGPPEWAVAPPAVEPLPKKRDRLDDDAVGGRRDRGGETRFLRGPRGPMLAVAGGLALASGGLYGYAWSERGTYLDPGTRLDELDAHRARTNAAAAASVATLGAAVGLGVVAVTVPW